MASDTGSASMSMSDDSDVTQPIVMPNSMSSDGKLSANDQQYLDLRYPTELPLNYTIANERRLQDLSHTLGAFRVIWLENYATVKNIAAAHERVKKLQRLVDEELDQARVEYESLGYDPLSTNLTTEQETNEKSRCMAAAREIFGDALMLGIQHDETYECHLIATTKDENNYQFELTDDWFDDDFFDKPVQPESEGSRLQEQAVEVLEYTADSSNANKRRAFKPTAELEINAEEGNLSSSGPTISEKGTPQGATPLQAKPNTQQPKSTHKPTAELESNREEGELALSQPKTSKKAILKSATTAFPKKVNPPQLNSKHESLAKLDSNRDEHASSQPTALTESTLQSATALPTKINSPQLKSTYESTAKVDISREERELASSQPTALKKGTLPRDKTVKSVFAAVHEQSSLSPRNISETSSAVPKAADCSRGTSARIVQPRALAPAPASQSILGGGAIHRVAAQVPDSQELSPRSLKHPDQQPGSSPDNALALGNFPQTYSPSSNRAGFPPRTQPQPKANVVSQLPNPFKTLATSTTISKDPRISTELFRTSSLPTDRAESSPRKENQAILNVVPSHRDMYKDGDSFAKIYQNSLPPHLVGYHQNAHPQFLKLGGQQASNFFGVPATTRNTPQLSTRSGAIIMSPFQPYTSRSDVTMREAFSPTSTPERTMSGPSASRTNSRPTELHYRPPYEIRSLPARPNLPTPSMKQLSKHLEKFPEFDKKHTPPADPTNPREIATCTFMSMEEKLNGEQLWLGMEWYQGEFYASWRASNPLFRMMQLLPRDEQSLSLEIIGPRGCGCRQALQQLFANKYYISTRNA